ncbi:MAG: YceI family protein [Rhodanobacter sp.]
MKRLAILLLACALPGAALATDYVVQPAASNLQFSGTFQGAPFTGQFSQWSATIRYDPAQLATAKFDVSVTPASVKTDDADQQDALPGADFFNVAKFPTAHFSSTGFRQNGAHVLADGNLTLRGVTKPISLNVTFTPNASGATLDVSGTLNRLNFGVGSGDYADTSVIGANVKVTAHLQLVKK